MRQLAVILFVMGFGFAGHAQTNATIAAPAPTAAPEPAAADTAPAKLTEPLSTTTADNTRYLNNPDLVTAATARLAALGDKPCDIIFIGDSITAHWLDTGKAIWESAYVPRHALNFGIDGDKTQNVLWRLNNMSIQGLKPKVAVVLIGTMNTMNTSHEIADGIKAILANTQAAFSGVKIILVSILPNERASTKMSQVNSLIKSYDDGDSVYFLNLVPLMPSTATVGAGGKIDASWKGIGPDHLNLDASGYQIWANAMEPLLTKLMGK